MDRDYNGLRHEIMGQPSSMRRYTSYLRPGRVRCLEGEASWKLWRQLAERHDSKETAEHWLLKFACARKKPAAKEVRDRGPPYRRGGSFEFEVVVRDGKDEPRYPPHDGARDLPWRRRPEAAPGRYLEVPFGFAPLDA
jgi:hypothetical protein